MLVDGWQIEHLHYADSCAVDGQGPTCPAAFVELTRPDQGRYGIYIPDDGRAFSHRSLVTLFRERPHIWKHRTAERIHQLAADTPMAQPTPPSEWGQVVDPFPNGLVFSPGTLRGVVAVNQTQSVEDVTISLTVLERYQQGGRLRFLAHTADPRKRKWLSVLDDVLVVDDQGRRYREGLLESRREGNRVDGALALAPGIPRDVAALTVTVGTVGDGRKPSESLRGPWVFPIQLTQPAPAPA
ncbi:MAG: hypothetical protein MUE51_11805 [Thermoleophilia bacterium]|jgi:hypothetical protein|nr:hypothetical protein [Thermoleophilia bacterium]